MNGLRYCDVAIELIDTFKRLLPPGIELSHEIEPPYPGVRRLVLSGPWKPTGEPTLVQCFYLYEFKDGRRTVVAQFAEPGADGQISHAFPQKPGGDHPPTFDNQDDPA